jgi:hypothetical protein
LLESYDTTLEQDMGMLDLWGSSLAQGGKSSELPVPKYHEQMAVQLRRGEKTILVDNLDRAKEMLKGISNSKAEVSVGDGDGAGAGIEEVNALGD